MVMTSAFAPAEQSLVASPQELPAVDVAIVGAGIVGLSLACALRNSGLAIALIEATPYARENTKGQAYALHQVSRCFFEGIGVWDQLMPHVQPFEVVQLSDGRFPLTVRFSPADLGTEAIGYVAAHAAIAETLQSVLQSVGNVTFYCPWRVVTNEIKGDRAQLTLISGDPAAPKVAYLAARLVVAADGGKSPLRQQMGIEPKGWQYGQSCVVATLDVAHPQPVIAYERFWPTGPMGVLPLAGNRYRVVWTLPHPEAEAVAALDDRAFLAKLQPYLDPQMAQITAVSDRFVFPTQLMQVNSYVADRFVVIGDAAHRCHPVGGQGLNLGLRDVWALAQQILATPCERLGDRPSLIQFHRQRWWQNALTLGFTDLLNRLFSNAWWPLVGVRRWGLWLLRTVAPFKRLVLRFMAGLLLPLPSDRQFPRGR